MKPFDAKALPKPPRPTLQGALGEGLMLAEYASRMSVKNDIEIGALTGDQRYDTQRYREAARAALIALAEESGEAAERIGRQRRWAAYLNGQAEHIHDYHPVDDVNLERRQELSMVLADALRERASDDDYLATLLERARQDAWAEIAAQIQASLDAAHITVDADYERDRDERMLRFVTEDLARLRPRESRSGSSAG